MNRLEVVVTSKEEAIIAEKGGADRLEISIAPEYGGSTPTYEMISEIVASVNLPCYVVLRPTIDTFEYSNEEYELLLHFVSLLSISNVKGIIVGVLKDGKVDMLRLEEIIAAAGSKEIIFSNAIDSTMNWETEILKLAKNKKISYIQTSGSAKTILDGKTNIAKIFDQIKEKLILSGRTSLRSIPTYIRDGYTDVIFQANSALRKNDLMNEELQINKIIEFKKELE